MNRILLGDVLSNTVRTETDNHGYSAEASPIDHKNPEREGNGEAGTNHKAGEEEECEEHVLPFGSISWWVYLGIVFLLTCFAGLCSGLTVGMLSIDKIHLKIVIEDPKTEPAEKARAERLYEILKKHHLLLATLLLCNAFAMESLPIFLDALVPAYMAIIISTSLV